MENQFKQIVSLIGDPTRATIMWTLTDGKAYTATELAVAAETSPQNISMHLSKLVQAGLLLVLSQGRHRYFKFSRKDVAYAIEAIANLIPESATNNSANGVTIVPVKYCRTCYDHLAGKIGVAVTTSLIKQKIIILRGDSFVVSRKGDHFFCDMGIDIRLLSQSRRALIRPCLDWSEREYHMSGSLASALLEKMIISDWLRKSRNSRAMIITAKGQKNLCSLFKISL